MLGTRKTSFVSLVLFHPHRMAGTARFAVRFELQEKRSMTDVCDTHYETPLGTTLLAADERGPRLISFTAGKRPEHPESHWRKDPAPLQEPTRQLRPFFAGELEDFRLP